MLNVLEKHLNTRKEGCVVLQWIQSLKAEEQQAFEKIKENNKSIHVSSLFKDLDTQTNLPFKLTAFRSHLRGYCTCPK